MDYRLMLDETYLIVGSQAPMVPDGMLQLGAFQPRSTVLGPGERAVVWVAGCHRRCPGCMKPDLFSFASGTLISVTELADRILEIPGIQGATFSGGEPFEQAHALAALGNMLKPAGLDIMVYSGYRRSALQADPDRFGPLLAVTDYLVDGEYREELPGPYRWRGSSNQVMYDLRNGDSIVEHEDRPIQEIQISVGKDAVRMSGFPDKHFIQALEQSLSQRGIQFLRVPGESLES